MIYLDHGATAFPRAPGVAQAMVRFLDEASGNPGRGGHRLAVAASRAIEAAREEMPDFLPDRLEAGTVNGAGAAGLGAACAWLGERTVEAVAEHEHGLVGLLAAGLSTIAGVQLHGWAESAPHTGILSFTVDGVDSGELASWLDREREICLRAGLHCAPAAHRRLGTFPNGTLRAGIGPFNTDADVDSVVTAIRDAAGGRM